MSEIDPINDRFIHQAGELAGSIGLSRSVGRIYAFLYMGDAPLSLDDIARYCRVSKGTASMSVRELLRWDAVRKACVPGERADYYLANRDIERIIINRISQGLERRLDFFERIVDEAAEELEKNSPSGRVSYLEKLKDISQKSKKFRKLLEKRETLHGLIGRWL